MPLAAKFKVSLLFLLALLLTHSLPLWSQAQADTTDGESIEQFKRFPWLVRVRSTYVDIMEPGRKVTFEGRGFIVNHREYQFVMTAAHLTEGGLTFDTETSTLEVEIYDATADKMVPVSISTNFADNFIDVATILIRPGSATLPSLASWTPKVELDEMAGTFRDGAYVVDTEAFARTPAPVEEFLWDDDGWLPVSLNSFIPVLNRRSRDTSEFLKVDRSPLWDVARVTSHDFVMTRLIGGMNVESSEFTTDFQVPPGMSGSPLLFRMPSASSTRVYVHGVVTARSRIFRQSWVSPTFHAASVMERMNLPHLKKWLASGGSLQPYFSGSGIQWYLREDLLFRIGKLPGTDWSYSDTAWDDDGTATDSKEDFLNIHEPTGDGIRADTGNGVRADTGDAGFGGVTEATRNSFELYEKLRILPGVVIGPPDSELRAAAFEVQEGDKIHLFAADVGGLNYIHLILTFYLGGAGEPVAIQRLLPTNDLTPALQRHLGRIFGEPLQIGRTSVWSSKLTAVKVSPVAEIGVEEESEIKVAWPVICAPAVRPTSCFQYQLKLGPNDYTFLVDGQGGVGVGSMWLQDGLYPFVSIPDTAGLQTPITIDLHTFLMQNPATAVQEPADLFLSRIKRGESEFKMRVKTPEK